MPAGLSPTHLLVILVVALIVLGPEKMPEAIRTTARALGEARQWTARLSQHVDDALAATAPVVPPPDAPAGAPVDEEGPLAVPTRSGSGSAEVDHPPTAMPKEH